MYIIYNCKLHLAQWNNVLYDRLGMPILDCKGAHQHACCILAFFELKQYSTDARAIWNKTPGLTLPTCADSPLAPCFPPSTLMRHGQSPNSAAFSSGNFGWHKSRPVNPPCGWHRLCAQPRLCERQKRRQLLSDTVQRVSLIHRSAPAPSPWPTASNGCKWAIECL